MSWILDRIVIVAIILLVIVVTYNLLDHIVDNMEEIHYISGVIDTVEYTPKIPGGFLSADIPPSVKVRWSDGSITLFQGELRIQTIKPETKYGLYRKGPQYYFKEE